MTYWNRKSDNDEVICDDCGDSRWESHPKYQTNVDDRIRERDETGADWCWDTVYSQVEKFDCLVCGVATH